LYLIHLIIGFTLQRYIKIFPSPQGSTTVLQKHLLKTLRETSYTAIPSWLAHPCVSSFESWLSRFYTLTRS